MHTVYRFHNIGNHKRSPYITRYESEKDFNEAVAYHMRTKSSHALFSDTKEIHPGILSNDERVELLKRIKSGEFKEMIPEKKRKATQLHTH